MKRIFLVIVALLLGSQSYAQNKLTPELMWKLYKVSTPSVSPDGAWIVYRAATSNVKANRNLGALYLSKTDGSSLKQLTELSENAWQVSWRPDGKKIGFLKVVDGEPQLFEIDAQGKNAASQVSFIKGGVDNYIYSPDIKHILFTQDVQVDPTLQQQFPNLPLDKCKAKVIDGLNYRHWDTWNSGAYTHVCYADYQDGKVTGSPQDILAGEPFDAPVKPFGGSEQIAWSPDGSKILYTSKKLKGTEYALSTNSDLFLFDLVKGTTINLTVDNPGYDNDPVFSPDGSMLAYHSMKTPGYESDKNRLILYDFNNNTRKDLTTNFDQSVDYVTWAPDGNTLFFTSGTKGTVQVYSYNIKSEKNPITQITNGWYDYISAIPAFSGKVKKLILTRMDFKTPPTLFSLDLNAKKKSEPLQISTFNNDLLKNITFGQIRQRWIKSTDSRKVMTWVLYPPDFDSTKKYPALLYCQGGPQSAVDQFFSVRWNLELMASNGYIVVAPNRRGLPGFGQAWNDSIVGDYGGQPMKDLLAAIDDVSAEPYVNKDKLGAVGASFGGYTIYWMAGNHNNRFKTFIAHDGMFNMVSWYGSTEEMFFANHDQKGSYWKNPGSYEKFSPVNFVKNWNTPILIIHGELDYRVPVTQGMEAFNAAQIKGIPSRFLYFPDENHWVLKPQNGLLWQAVFFDWLDKYLK
jgi:dipeptidyl aminopeptidase/acylaminoacyl peptidase